MHKDKFVFAQLVEFLDRNHFNYLVRKYLGDKYIKFFTCWDQLLVMMFGELAKCESLRDLIVALEAHWRKLYLHGITKACSQYKDSTSEYKRQNDLYIFCLNTGNTKEESNPLHIENWQFYVVPTKIIDERCKDNKTISLGQVQKLTGSKTGVSFIDLKKEIDSIIERL